MNKKIIAVIILVFIAAASGAAYFFFNQKNVSNVGNLEEMKRSQDYEMAKKAAMEKKIEYCYSLDPKRIDECIFSVAKNGNDMLVCDNIQDEGFRVECKESIIYDKIVGGDDIKKCSELKLEKIYSQCLLNFFWKWDSLEKCSEAEEKDRVDCMDIINKKTAYNNNDESRCDSIKDSGLKEDCFAVLKSKPKDSDNDGILDSDEISYGTNPYSADTDGDGLNDLDELKIYFTNPRAADTDGDGYADGNEIKSGYNPKGEGRLIAQ